MYPGIASLVSSQQDNGWDWDAIGKGVGSIANVIGGFSNPMRDAYDSAARMPGGLAPDYIKNMVEIERLKANDMFAAQGASQAASAANARAAAGAAAATERNRLGALRKAKRHDKKARQQILSYYQPYVDAGRETLPVMQDMYKQGANTASMLNAYLSKPESMEMMNPGYSPRFAF